MKQLRRSSLYSASSRAGSRRGALVVDDANYILLTSLHRHARPTLHVWGLGDTLEFSGLRALSHLVATTLVTGPKTGFRSSADELRVWI